jgi:predicted Zn-ribbon and HTH transcriptional regulator
MWADFLEGFVLLLRGGPVNRLTWSHRIFLSTFVKSSGLAKSLKSKNPVSQAFFAAESALTTVSIQIRPIDTDDLRQEINELFLATLRRYRSRNDQNYLIPYIQKSFPYALCRRVQQLIKDPLVNLASDKILTLEHFQDGVSHTKGEHRSATIPLRDFPKLTKSYEDNVADIGEDSLGNSWLRGESCHEAFECLTYAERRLILDFYHYQKTDSQIAEKLGVSYNTAIRRRHLIEKKLRGEYEPPKCQYCGVEITKAALGRQPRQCPGCREIRHIERQQRRKLKAQGIL